ncbi:MAG: hypothetical protein JXR73_12425 [Candidatus Omnitrophica bacterium]|nr:hypothetical protein [Candidatus Omnitrophota bacterium]
MIDGADPSDIVDAGFMVVGDVDNVGGTIHVDDIHFISDLPSASVQGVIQEGKVLPG